MSNENQTIEQFVKTQLTEMGMFPQQAEEVFIRIVEDKSMETMRGRWRDKVSDYPKPMLATIIMIGIKRICLNYIDETCPQAWFRPMFLPIEEQKKIFPAELFNK